MPIEHIKKIAPVCRKHPHARLTLTIGVCCTTALAFIGAELGMTTLAMSGTLGSLAVNILWIWEDLG